MTISAATVWEVRTTGSDTANSGGFVAGASGTDYSQQAAAQYSASDLTSANGTSTTPSVTSPSHSYVAADVGNILRVTGGTNWTAGFYQIVSVSAGAATLDKACGTSASLSGGSYCVGGALASPGQAAAGVVGGNVIWVQSGTYLINSASANISGGCISLPQGTAANCTKLIGYGSSRGDGGTQPLLQASSISTFTLVTAVHACHVENLSFDGQSLTSSRGINVGGFDNRTYRCNFKNFTNSAISAAGPASECFLCAATGCSTASAFLSGCYFYCVAYANSISGFGGFNTGCICVGCVSVNNTGSSHGFANTGTNQFIDCLAYGNALDGFNITAGISTPTLVNCRSEKNGRYGYNASSNFDGLYLLNCSAWNNTTANVNTTVLNKIGMITCTADPSVNASGLNFALNNNAGAGAILQAAGVPTPSGNYSLPGLSTPAYPDLGPTQHQGSTGTVIGSAIIQPTRRSA